MLSNFAVSLLPSKLPSDWRLVSAGAALADSAYGVGDAGDSAGEIEVIGMKDIKNGYVSVTSLGRIGGSLADYTEYKLEIGDILLNRTNSPDLVGKVGVICEATNAIFASYLVRLRANRNIADPFFLAQWLNGDIAQRALKRIATRAVSQANINPTEFKRQCPVPLPPLPEQRKIVEILRTWDEAIEAAEKLVEQLQRRQQALVYQLVFGGRRLGNYARSSEFQKARWLSVPTDWAVVPIGAIAEERSNVNRNGGAAEVLSCSKYQGFVRSLEYFKKQVFSSDLSSYKIIRRGEFGFPSNHVEEGSIGLQNLVEEGLVSPIYTVFRFDADRVDNDYAYSVLKTELYRHIFQVSTSASVDRRGSLRWSEFSTLPFPLPSIDEQRAIQKVIAAGQSQIVQQLMERDALAKQKRGLMQKLLTGEWRVNDEAAAS
jgi:type I restriction enzyme S subunit